MFNYQSPGCANQNGPTNMTVSGSTLLANHSTSDFALLELNENPPESYNVHMLDGMYLVLLLIFPLEFITLLVI